MATLLFIIFLPLAAALLLCVVPRNFGFAMRLAAVTVTFITMLLAIKLFWQFDSGASAPQFETIRPWVTQLGISFHIGVDGLNIGLILMGAVVAFAAACS